MPTYTDTEKAQYLSKAQSKVAAISETFRAHLDRAEENARGYVEALADLGAISNDLREELYAKAKETAAARLRVCLADEAEYKCE